MEKCNFEDIKNLDLFNSNYKVKIKGTISLRKFDHLYVLESHGELYFLRPNNQKEELMIYKNLTEEELNSLKKEASICHKYEQEIIIDKSQKLFTTNVFSIIPNENALFVGDSETLFAPCNELQKIIGKLLKNMPKEDFFEYINEGLKKKSIDEIIKEHKSPKTPIMVRGVPINKISER